MSEIINFPKSDEPPDLLLGPFDYFQVIVGGRAIPRLTGRKEGDQIALIVDGRFSASFPEKLAHDAAWLIAQALAIGEGYTHLGAENKEAPFAPRAMQINPSETAP